LWGCEQLGAMRRKLSGDRTPPIRDLREGLSGPSHYDRYSNRLASIAWVTPLIIAANVVVFGAMAVTFHSIATFSPIQLAMWGGNSGTLDLSGQWWRLITYQFLHANLLHIAVNMWVMWAIGRLTERLYGSFTLLFLYLAAGVLAGLASIVWNPEQISVGASGSIFGIVGAFLAFVIRARNESPLSVLRYWLPVLLFVIFNLVSGAYQPGIDNAAHVGGLLAGFGLGAIMVQPVESRDTFPLMRILAAGLFAGMCAVFPLWYLGAFEHRASALEQFTLAHPWYVSGESANLQLWQKLAAQAAAGTVSNDEVGKRFERDIVPFWQQASSRLQVELSHRGGDKNAFVPLVADFARRRLDLAQAVIATARDNNPQRLPEILDDAQQVELAQARLDRMELRDTAENLPVPLGDSAVVIWMGNWIPAHDRRCVAPPAAIEKSVSATDADDDGPAERHAAGCLAQRMFMKGDYEALDASMRKYSGELSDLPDGSSRLEGIWAGLGDLFDYGGIAVDEALRRTAGWRKSVRGSAEPELVEALMFRIWAYGARGHGDASTVSPQALALYLARTEMAAVDLREVAVPAANNPEWYALSLGVDRDQSIPIEQQRAIFDEGAAKFPAYTPLYRQMLTSLMPRWSGSDVLVDRFILEVANKSDGGKFDAAVYARLYLIYGDLEGSDYNVSESANAVAAVMKAGLDKLRQRYPKSDYILNATARFACIGNDAFAYRAIRPMLNGHVSATAWPDKLTVASCDKLSS
jgi:membrane associated rhomboid family serine protease